MCHLRKRGTQEPPEPFQFTCANCHCDVTFMDAGLRRYEHRNQCPHCLWSRHIMFGTAQLRPCDGLMRPLANAHAGQPLITTECENCGFRWVTYDEDWWATLEPGRQAEMINTACTETGRQNGSPTVIYSVRPRYRNHPPPMPAGQLGTRNRVNRRP